MKLGFSTVADVNATVDEVIEAALANGISNVEVRLDTQNLFFGMTETSEIEAAAEKFRKAGITVSDLGASITVIGDNPGCVEKAAFVMQTAKIVGAKGFRVFLAPFYRKYSDKKPHDYDGIVKTLKAMAALAEETGIEVWIETHNAFSTGAVLKKLLADIGSEKVKIIWDIMHPYELGEQPDETAEYLKGKVAHVHIKDGVKYEDPDMATMKYTVLGEGTVPVRTCLEALKKIGFDGVLSLEWEKAWRPEIADVYPNLSDTLAAYVKYIRTVGNGII
ncbi:MAG: sugar phosphate isomerase/epimerase [Clostridia bacterium]|nr:sugar phosphate isomerase/epimerase [Clostridia bacterium]